MASKKRLLQLARLVLDEVMKSVNAQNQIVEGILRDIQDRLVPRVREAWIGTDEVAFEWDVNNRLAPAIRDVMTALTGYHSSGRQAETIVVEADLKARQTARNLVDEFNQI
jgi:hypothetical protein